MAKTVKMKVCKHCGQEVKAKAKYCPVCGIKNKKPIFTRWWFWLVVISVLLIALVRGDSEKDIKETSAAQGKVVAEEKKTANPLLECQVLETDVKSGSGNVIGKRAYIECSEADFNNCTNEQIAEFALGIVDGADYNYFTIDFGNGRGVVFTGCVIYGASIGEIDETGAITKSERTLYVSADGTVKIETDNVTEETVDESAEEPTEAKETEAEVSKEFKNALAKAETYSSFMHMSKKGIYDQLTSEYGERFPEDAAQYAVDNMTSDWNANALAKAKDYSDSMYMSKKGIYDQLISEYGEQFAEDEAQYAVDNLEADYNANALEKAKVYQDSMNMSKAAIYDQLISEYGEQFTKDEAQYAVDHLDD